MSPTKQTLHNLIDVIDFSEVDIVYRLLLKFIPEDIPAQDEILFHDQVHRYEYLCTRDDLSCHDLS